MVKFPEAQARKYRNVFICKKCSTKIRADSMKILHGKVKCRRCNFKRFRAVRKK